MAAAEKTIEAGVKTFFAVGMALAKVRDGKLYRDQYTTFEDYCKHRWGFGKSQAYRMIDASNVLAELSPIGDAPQLLPQNEAQIRPLLSLKPDERQTVWKDVIEKAKNGHVTAKLVENVAKEYRKPIVRTPRPVAVPEAPPTLAKELPSVKPAKETPPLPPEPQRNLGGRTANDIAFEAGDSAVTYLRLYGDKLDDQQKRDWERLMNQLIDLCKKYAVTAIPEERNGSQG